jgi:hypothetical protein
VKRSLLLLAALALVGCNGTPTGSSTTNLAGAYDLVVADLLPDAGLAGRELGDDGSTKTLAGMPSKYVFVTSTANNELRVREYRDGIEGRDFVRAPNPLEALSIPVLDRPTRLVVDEGRNIENARVTGPYVYATRPGAEEVSVVSVMRRRQLSGHPFATPAPVTDLTAWMEVDRTARPAAVPLPATTRLFISTWDGSTGAIYVAELPTNAPELESLSWTRLVSVDGAPIVAIAAVAPSAARTLDGAAFCTTKGCLAYAVRRDGGGAGETRLFDPETRATASLDFGAPVRKLVASEAFDRVYGVLDEQPCGSPACGGVLGVDVLTGVGGEFPRAKTALGQTMEPLRSSGLITGLSVAAQLSINVTTPVVDAGQVTLSRTLLSQEYAELGVFTSSTGELTYFSGLAGSIIDHDGRRATVTSSTVRLPGTLSDGGVSLVAEDGGVLGTTSTATISTLSNEGETWTTTRISGPGGDWVVDLSDGYLESQRIAAVVQGQLPGLTQVPVSGAASTFASNGFETRAEVGDVVIFETGTDALGYRECGRSTVASVGAGTITMTEVPASCGTPARYTVRATGARSVVLAGDVEGYMGRFASGATATYNRPLVLIPAGVTSARTAFSLTIPDVSAQLEGTGVTLQVEGALSPYRISIDPLLGCYAGSQYQLVFGAVQLRPIPAPVSNSDSVTFRTGVFASVPSANSIAEFNPLLTTRVGLQGSSDGINCRR